MIDLERIVVKAESLGATEAEVYFRKARTVAVRFTDKVESVDVRSASGIGLRVAVGRRVSVVGTEDLTGVGLENAVRSALAVAKASPEDGKWKSLPSNLGVSPIEGSYCRRTAELQPGEAVGFAVEAMKAVAEASPLSKPVRGLLAASLVEASVANSYGGPVSRSETRVQFYVTARAEEAGFSTTFTRFKVGRSVDEVNPSELGVEAGREAPKFLKAKPLKPGEANLVLHQEVAASILDTMLSPAISAESVQRGRSPLAGKLGSQVLSEKVTVVDEGTRGWWVGSRSFDDEGVPTADNVLIEKGFLKSYVYDTYTANVEGRESTGNAHRTLSSVPRPSPNMLVLNPGGVGLEEMFEEIGEGYYVVATIGEWLSNPVSGSMQATITHAYRIEKGELSYPVKGAVATADFYRAFNEGLAFLGKELVGLTSSAAPPLALRNVKISG